MSNIVLDIYKLFGPTGIEITEDEGAAFGRALALKITTRMQEDGHRSHLSLSQLGEKCDRKLWYKMNEPEKAEPLPPTTRIKFLYGDILEELLLFLLKKAGYNVTDEQKEVAIHFTDWKGKEQRVLGHLDAKVNGVTTDVKSASTFSFTKFDKGTLSEDDSFGYIDQLDSYLNAEGEDAGQFLAIDKQFGHIAVLPMERKRSLKESQALAQVKDYIVSTKPMPNRAFVPVSADAKSKAKNPRPPSGNMKLPVNCGYCAWKHECWPGVRTFLYASGPVYMTTVKRLPKVMEVDRYGKVLSDPKTYGASPDGGGEASENVQFIEE